MTPFDDVIKRFEFWHQNYEARFAHVFFKGHTMFENNPKCLICIFQFWHFPPIFARLKLTYLVTLF